MIDAGTHVHRAAGLGLKRRVTYGEPCLLLAQSGVGVAARFGHVVGRGLRSR